MEKNVLNLYISKVAEGDRSYVTKLCARLADRLLYIPLLGEEKSKGKASTRVNVVRIASGDRSLVPVFTAEKKFKHWQKVQGKDFESLSLLGCDFCAVLDADAWLLIDPENDPSVELCPDDVDLITQDLFLEVFEAEKHRAPVSGETVDVNEDNGAASPEPSFEYANHQSPGSSSMEAAGEGESSDPQDFASQDDTVDAWNQQAPPAVAQEAVLDEEKVEDAEPDVAPAFESRGFFAAQAHPEPRQTKQSEEQAPAEVSSKSDSDEADDNIRDDGWESPWEKKPRGSASAAAGPFGTQNTPLTAKAPAERAQASFGQKRSAAFDDMQDEVSSTHEFSRPGAVNLFEAIPSQANRQPDPVVAMPEESDGNSTQEFALPQGGAAKPSSPAPGGFGSLKPEQPQPDLNGSASAHEKGESGTDEFSKPGIKAPPQETRSAPLPNSSKGSINLLEPNHSEKVYVPTDARVSKGPKRGVFGEVADSGKSAPAPSEEEPGRKKKSLFDFLKMK